MTLAAVTPERDNTPEGRRRCLGTAKEVAGTLSMPYRNSKTKAASIMHTREWEPATLELLTRYVGMHRADGVDQVTCLIGDLPTILKTADCAYTNVGMIDLDGKHSDAEHEQAKESLLSLQEATKRLRFHRAPAYETSHSGRGFHTYLWMPQPIPFEDIAVIMHGWAWMVTTPDATALRALLKTLSALQGLSCYELLLIITPPRASGDAEEARAALEELGLNVVQTHVPRAAALQKAALESVTVREVRAHVEG